MNYLFQYGNFICVTKMLFITNKILCQIKFLFENILFETNNLLVSETNISLIQINNFFEHFFLLRKFDFSLFLSFPIPLMKTIFFSQYYGIVFKNIFRCFFILEHLQIFF